MRTFAWLGFLLAALVVCGLSPRASAGPVDSLQAPDVESLDLSTKNADVVAAISEFRKGNNPAALELLEQAHAAEPSLPPAKIMLARMLLVAGRANEGRRLLEEVSQQSPDAPDVYALFGNIALSESRLTDALLHYAQLQRLATGGSLPAAQAKKFQIRSLAGIAAVAEIRRDWPAAEVSLRAWLELDENASAIHRLARVRCLQGQSVEALAGLKLASRLDPKLDPPETTFGWLLTEGNQLSEAEESLRQGITNHPQDSRAYFGFANWLLGQERAADAVAIVEQARKIEDSPRLKFLAAIIARQTKNVEQAEELLRALVQESPGEFGPTNQLALLLAGSPERDDRQKALQLAEFNVRQHSTSKDALATLGWTLINLGRYRDAEQVLQKAVTGGVMPPESAYYVARLQSELGNKEEALRLLKASMESPLGQFFSRADARVMLAELSAESPNAAPAADLPTEAPASAGSKPKPNSTSRAPAAAKKPAGGVKPK